MIESVPLTTAQKIVTGLKKTEGNGGIQMYLGFNLKLLFFFT